jgi:hypothetical protein
MGAFYGAVYIRTEERDQVREILEEIAGKKKTRFLLAPPFQGWTGVYPDTSGQDENVAKAIARRTPADVLQVIVHDDDVFCYFYYRAGRLVDQYNSRPDYFESVDEEAREELRGRPDLLRDLLPDAESVAALEAILREAGEQLFASQSLEQFAQLLHLPNSLTCYDYLMEGETEGIEGWDEFIHIPDLSAKKVAKRAQEDATATEKQRIRNEGLLLLEQAGGGTGEYKETPVFCSDPHGAGFMVCWSNLVSPKAISLLRYAPPWSAGPLSTGLELESFGLLCASPSGRYLFSAGWKGQLWDLDQKAFVLEVQHPRGAIWADFTADEKLLISRSTEEVIVTDLKSRSQLAAFLVPGGQRAALHPSGTKLVVDVQANLGILDLASGRLTSPLCVGERQDFTAHTLWLAQQMKKGEAQVDFGAVQEKVTESLRKMGLDVAGMAEQLQKNLEQMKQAHAKIGTPEWLAEQAPIRGSEQPMNLAFSSDGKLFFCATSQGARVYSWEEMLASGEQVPRPLYAVDSLPYPHESSYGLFSRMAHTYALAYDAKAHRLLFGGLSGTIDYLDLHTGQPGTLIEPPGRPAINQLALSGDGSALACLAVPDTFERGKQRKPPLFQIWNFAALSEAIRS